jgi:ubiquinone/menaquinone biosynthesis C-methylase UbiE
MSGFDRIAHCYDETRAIPPEVSAAVACAIADAMGGHGARPVLLEVGVGTGRIAGPLADAGVRVIGIDVAPAMLARLRTRWPGLPVLRAAAERLPFGAAVFDAVLFVHVLHLLGDGASALRAARTVLRPGGALLSGRQEFGDAPLEPVAVMMAEALAELIRRLAPRVESLVGDLDRPTAHEARFVLTIARCP